MTLAGSRMALVAALLVSLAAAGLFAYRAAGHSHRMRATLNEPIRPWMSIPYIAHSWHVPQGALWKSLGIAPHQHDHRPIGRIARQERRPVAELMHTLQHAIETTPKDAP